MIGPATCTILGSIAHPTRMVPTMHFTTVTQAATWRSEWAMYGTEANREGRGRVTHGCIARHAPPAVPTAMANQWAQQE